MDWVAIKAGSVTSIILILAYTIYMLVTFVIKKYRKNDNDYQYRALKENIVKSLANELELGKVYPALVDIQKLLSEIRNYTNDIKNTVDRIDEKMDKFETKIAERFDAVHSRINKVLDKIG